VSDDPAGATALAKGVGAMVGYGHNFSEPLLEAEPSVQWIQTLTAGTDALLALKAVPRDAVVTSTAGIQGPQMAEMAFLHMLMLNRRYLSLLENQRAHRWERWPQAVLFGKTVVIVGVGGIAAAVARRCKAFEMNVIGVSATPRDVAGFDRIMPREQLAQAAALADFLIILAPLTPATRHLVDAKVLAAMKPSAFVINISRGGVLDDQALLDALDQGRLAGAGLDVFENEPPPPDSPMWNHPKVVVTPHVGGMSEVFGQQLLPILEENLRCYEAGRWSDMVNRVAR